MAQSTVTVTSPMGLHARPAGHIARLAAASGFNITIAKKGDDPVDAASILSIMGLGLNQGDDIVVSCADEAAQPLIDEIIHAIETDGAEH